MAGRHEAGPLPVRGHVARTGASPARPHGRTDSARPCSRRGTLAPWAATGATSTTGACTTSRSPTCSPQGSPASSRGSSGRSSSSGRTPGASTSPAATAVTPGFSRPRWACSSGSTATRPTSSGRGTRGPRSSGRSRALPLRPGTFDAIYSWYSSLFMYDDEENLALPFRGGYAPRPGGRLLVHHDNPARLARALTAHEEWDLARGGGWWRTRGSTHPPAATSARAASSAQTGRCWLGPPSCGTTPRRSGRRSPRAPAWSSCASRAPGGGRCGPPRRRRSGSHRTREKDRMSQK